MMNRIEFGDCREIMNRWIAEGVKAQMCVTSPPYFGLRDYGVDGQIGLEKTPDEYVAGLVEVFRRVRDLLADDGTFWLNLGDSYAGSWGNYGGQNRGNGRQREITVGSSAVSKAYEGKEKWRPPTSNKFSGIKNKDLIGIPWRVAFALQADGWYLRQDIIWAKPNPMPESVLGRCTRSHEYLFLLSKSPKYFFDNNAIKEPCVRPDEGKRKTPARFGGADKWVEAQNQSRLHSGNEYLGTVDGKRNRRDVWNISVKSYKGARFATFPPDLIEPCILVGSRPGDIVLDPFMGSGTTAQVALKHGRQYLGCELNPAYKELQDKRIEKAKEAA